MNSQVASIHGYLLPLKNQFSECFFLRGADCWGWATWRDRWSTVEWDAQSLLQALRLSRDRASFNFLGAYPFEKMLEKQSLGEIDSWAIRWHASMFLQNRLTLYPQSSLVLNTGNDGSGTHGKSSMYATSLATLEDFKFPTKVEPSQKAFDAFLQFYELHRQEISAHYSKRVSTILKSVFRKFRW